MGCSACHALHNGSLEVEFLCYVLLAELPRTDTVRMDRRGPRATGRTGTLVGFREAWGLYKLSSTSLSHTSFYL